MTKSKKEELYTPEEALKVATDLIELASDDRMYTHTTMKNAFDNGVAQLIDKQPPVVHDHRMIVSCSQEFDGIVSNLKMIDLTIKSGEKPNERNIKLTQERLTQIASRCSKID